MQGRVTDPVLEILERDAARVRIGSPRRIEAVQLSLARDAGGWLLGNVPVVGPFLADAYRDNLWADLRRRLTSEEVETYTDVTRRYPDTIALVSTFQQLPE